MDRIPEVYRGARDLAYLNIQKMVRSSPVRRVHGRAPMRRLDTVASSGPGYRIEAKDRGGQRGRHRGGGPAPCATPDSARRQTGPRRKTKSRDTHEVIVGGVLGPIERPDVVIAGLHDADGTLVNVGRTVPLKPAQSRDLAAVLQPAGPDHPWPDLVGTSRFNRSREKVSLTKVEPSVVVEISADTGLQAGAWRHPLRFIRIRSDLRPTDLPNLDDPTATA